MLSELPDLDDEVSFVVDNGAATGPIPLREIVNSIRAGERAPGVLVWWAGATDWIRFDLREDLLELLEDDSVIADRPTEVAEDEPADVPSGPFRWRASRAAASVVMADEIIEELAIAESAVDEGAVDAEDAVVEDPAADGSDIDDAAAQEVVVDESADDEAAVGEEVVEDVLVEEIEAIEDDHVTATIEDDLDEVEVDEVSEFDHVEFDHVEFDHVELDDDVNEFFVEATELTDGSHPIDESEPQEVSVSNEHEVDVAPEGVEPEEAEPEEADHAGLEIETAVEEDADHEADSGSAIDAEPQVETGHEADSEIDDEADFEPALTGLFGADARTDAGLSPETSAPSADALDTIVAARLSLESVGARIEALTSATRRSPSPESEQSQADDGEALAHAKPINSSVDDSEPDLDSDREPAMVSSPIGVETHDEPGEAEVTPAGSWHAVAPSADIAPRAEPVQRPVEVSETTAPHVASRQILTERFEEMVRKSAAHQRRIEWITRVDELLLSACITAIADSGFVALDLTSRESDHRVLFEHNDDSRHVRLDLAPVEMKSDLLGRHVRFGLSWGRSVPDLDVALDTVSRHAAEGAVSPGVLTCSADVSNSIVSTHVELLLAADDLVKDDYSVDRPTLDASIAATLHALEEHWKLLFTAD